MLEKLTDIKLKMVDGGTVSDRVVGMLGGRLDLGAITYGSVQDCVSGGQMVALGQPNDERNPLLGDVPTLREQGLDITMDKPYVVAFPKGTDPAIVKKMADVMKQITEIPEYAEDLKKFSGRWPTTAPTRPSRSWPRLAKTSCSSRTSCVRPRNKPDAAPAAARAGWPLLFAYGGLP